MTKLYCTWKDKTFYINHYVKNNETQEIGFIISIIKNNISKKILVKYNDRKILYIDEMLNNLDLIE